MATLHPSINYMRKGSGQPFIFQHGLGSKLQQPQGLLSDLEEVELISMDCPGHGQSPLLEGIRPSFRYYTDQVCNLMDQLTIPQAILGGISMGAGISLQLALRYPEKVKALVLVRPAWLDHGAPQNLAILLEAAELIRKEKGKRLFELREDFLAIQKPLPKAGASVLGVFADTQQQELPVVLESLVKDAPFPNRNELKKIQVPCLILGNEDDPLHPYEMAQTLSEYITGSQLHKVTSRYIDGDTHKRTITEIVSTFIHTL
ncbi:MAG: alpha/beta hydrolase [Bacteroidota bacterium]